MRPESGKIDGFPTGRFAATDRLALIMLALLSRGRGRAIWKEPGRITPSLARCSAIDNKEDLIMLVLTRKFGESIVIGDSVTVTVIDSKGERVRLGVEAPAEVPVHREEVLRKIEAGLFDSTRG